MASQGDKRNPELPSGPTHENTSGMTHVLSSELEKANRRSEYLLQKSLEYADEINRLEITVAELVENARGPANREEHLQLLLLESENRERASRLRISILETELQKQSTARAVALLSSCKRKRDDNNQNTPDRIVPCTNCFKNKRDCDNGNPCESCTSRKIASAGCKRMACQSYGNGLCKKRKCTLAHDGDGYQVLTPFKIRKTRNNKKAFGHANINDNLGYDTTGHKPAGGDGDGGDDEMKEDDPTTP